jgi:hypothetical protein
MFHQRFQIAIKLRCNFIEKAKSRNGFEVSRRADLVPLINCAADRDTNHGPGYSRGSRENRSPQVLLHLNNKSVERITVSAPVAANHLQLTYNLYPFQNSFFICVEG